MRRPPVQRPLAGSAQPQSVVLRALARLAILLVSPAIPAAEEFRGLWVDTFHPAMRNDGEIRQLVSDARTGGFNALLVEVRKRGDAYYASEWEPLASDVAPGFDPLQRLLELAHDTTSGPRLEVHAWIVAFNIWNQRNTPPPQPAHPYRLHPDWLTRSYLGETWDGANYAFDPGHPGVQEHTFHVAMDLVRNYDLDGLHWDYIRYAGLDWGYNDVAVARFNARAARTGRPHPADPEWSQFRRDQVTELVRKVYLSALAEKPALKVSAATITFAPGIFTTAQWPTSAAYSQVLQDWRLWMEEGILDLNVPMAYFRQAEHRESLARWNLFIKDHQYGRQAAIGLGFYLNAFSDSVDQVRLARTPSASGNTLAGLCAFSYATLATDVPRGAVLSSLTHPSPSQPDLLPAFGEPAVPPPTPWKHSPARAHLKGFLRSDSTGEPMDGGRITLCGPDARSLRADATGFFGAVDLEPGSYSLVAIAPNSVMTLTNFNLTGAMVTHLDLSLASVAEDFMTGFRVSAGYRSAVVTWSTSNLTSAELRLVPQPCGEPSFFPTPRVATSHSVLLASLEPSQAYTLDVLATLADGSPASSGALDFSTAGELALDNSQAAFAGTWTTGTGAPGRFGSDYRFASTIAANGTAATAVWEVLLPATGEYAVDVWYPAGSNRSRRAPFDVTDLHGTRRVEIDQTRDGGAWMPLVSSTRVLAGVPATVTLRNATGEPGRVVVADAVRWRYLPRQDEPSSDRLPAWWSRHFFGMLDASPLEDPDQDGLSNADEYLAGSDPTERTSSLALKLPERAAAHWRLGFAPSTEGRVYLLQTSRPPAWSEWLPIEAEPRDDHQGGGVFEIPAPTGASAFFRLAVTPITAHIE